MKNGTRNFDPASTGLAAGDATRRRIAEKAYEIFERRGAGHGRDLDDWLQAERLVREETRARAAVAGPAAARPAPSKQEPVKVAAPRAAAARPSSGPGPTPGRSKRRAEPGH